MDMKGLLLSLVGGGEQEHLQGYCRSHPNECCCDCGLFLPHFPGAEAVWAHDEGWKTLVSCQEAADTRHRMDGVESCDNTHRYWYCHHQLEMRKCCLILYSIIFVL